MKFIWMLAFVVLVAGCIGTEKADSTVQTTIPEVQPKWLDIELTNVNDGSTFRLSDFAGQIVILETMAVWCPLCKQQQREIMVASKEGVISISLDVDPNENTEQLKQHAQSNGFLWRYAVAPREMSLLLQQYFGSNVLNPTATPIIIIDKQQNPHLLRYGIKGANELKTEISKYA